MTGQDTTYPIRWTSRRVLKTILASVTLIWLSVLVAMGYAWAAIHGGPLPTVLGATVPLCGGVLLAYGFRGFVRAERRRQPTSTREWRCGVVGACLAVVGMILPLYLL